LVPYEDKDTKLISNREEITAASSRFGKQPLVAVIESHHFPATFRRPSETMVVTMRTVRTAYPVFDFKFFEICGILF